jgi:hypothetical protein
MSGKAFTTSHQSVKSDQACRPQDGSAGRPVFAALDFSDRIDGLSEEAAMRVLIGAVTSLALIVSTIAAADAATAKHKSHKAPKTEYMRAVPSGTAPTH